MDYGKKAAVYAGRKIIAFDLDGTLTASKQPMDAEMARLVCRLLAAKRVAVVSGGNLAQMRAQFLRRLQCLREARKNLLVLPTSGASMYAFRGGKFSKVYAHALGVAEVNAIRRAFREAFVEAEYVRPATTYGAVLENRATQVTFSALGRKAPVEAKERWRASSDIRPRLARALRKRLGGFSVRLGGMTSIDVTKEGIDKAYGMREVMKFWRARKEDVVYVGDALFKGGNDEAVKKTGVAVVQVKNHEDTKKFIRALLSHIERP